MSRDRYGIKFTKHAAKRLTEVGRYVEQQPRNRAPTPGPPVDLPGGVVFLLTTATGRMTGNTPDQTGRGYLQSFNGTSFSNFGTTTYPILNTTTNIFAVGSYVTCIQCCGKWSIVNVDKCSNIS